VATGGARCGADADAACHRRPRLLGVFAQSRELIESLEWILPGETRAKLAAKRLIVDDPDQLERLSP
jgi:hypothetical protein